MMTINAENILVAAVLAAVLWYAGRQLLEVLRGRRSPCDSCELKKNCKKFCEFK
jgi:hypothetical protein